MSLFDRMLAEESSAKDEKKENQKWALRTVKTAAEDMGCKQLIPIINSFLKEFCSKFNCIVENRGEDYSPGGYSRTMRRIWVYGNIGNWLLPKKTYSPLFIIDVGKTYVYVEKNKDVKVIPLHIGFFIYDSDKNAGAKYHIPNTGINEQDVKDWLENTLYECRRDWRKN